MTMHSQVSVKTELKNVIGHWRYLEKSVYIPTSKTGYEKLSHLLDALLDIVGSDEKHELAALVYIIGSIMEDYEKKHFQDIGKKTTPIDILKFLMEQHQLKQSDLPEVGPQSIVSDVLHGKRLLNAKQIVGLCQRFHVSADLFLGID